MPPKKTAAQLQREIDAVLVPNLTPFELALLRLHRRMPDGRKRSSAKIVDAMITTGFVTFDRRDPESARNRVSNTYRDLRRKLGAHPGEGAAEAAERIGVRF